MAILEWCKLFGEEKHEPQHWQWVLEDKEKLRTFKQTLKNLGAKGDWSAHRTRSINYRNKFLAHQGLAREMLIPSLDLTRRSAIYYAEFLFERENDGRTYGTLQGDPDTAYLSCTTCRRGCISMADHHRNEQYGLACASGRIIHQHQVSIVAGAGFLFRRQRDRQAFLRSYDGRLRCELTQLAALRVYELGASLEKRASAFFTLSIFTMATEPSKVGALCDS